MREGPREEAGESCPSVMKHLGMNAGPFILFSERLMKRTDKDDGGREKASADTSGAAVRGMKEINLER